MTLQHLRSSTANKRPTPAAMSDGQIAINNNTSSPGLFFKDSAGALIKVGPVHVGSTAPNDSPASGGETGNSVGEQWLDTSSGYVFKIWDGSAWRSDTGTFVDVNGDTMTGALGIIAGSASTPGLFFSGDTNTGIYSPGADQVAISTNGTRRLQVSSDGTLNLFGANKTAAGGGNTVVYSTDTQAVDVGGSIGFGGYYIGTSSDTEWAQIAGRKENSTSGNYAGYLQFATRVNGGSTSEKMRLTSDGKLGLGTSAPSNDFDLVKTASGSTATARIGATATSGANNATLILNNGGTGNATLRFDYEGSTNRASIGVLASDQKLTFGTAGSTAMTIDASQRVGIGNTTPGSFDSGANQLVVGSGTGNNGLTLYSGSSSFGNIYFADGTAGSAPYIGFIQYRHDDNSLRFGTNDNTRLTIDSSGRCGIGTATFGDARESLIVAPVSGQTSTFSVIKTGSASANSSLYFGDTDSNSVGGITYEHSTDAFAFRTNGSERFRCDSSGRMLIGTSSSSSTVTALLQGNSGGSTSYGALRLARGTTSPADSETLGYVVFSDSGHGDAAAIDCKRDGGTWNTSTSRPTRLTFSTTADGASSPTERMRIDSAGYLTGITNGLGNGRIPAMQYYRLNSDLTGSGATTAQSALGVGVTLVGSTVYEFEAQYIMTRTGAGNPSISTLFALTNSLSLNNIGYIARAQSDTAQVGTTVYQTGVTAATAVAVVSAGRNFVTINLKGTLSVNVGGTLTPQYQLGGTLSAGSEYAMKTGSYFSIWPLGAAGSATSIGSWA